jgi:cob(I)alamin adenosyltransferase
MTPFYTRKGDDGYSGILGEERLPKHHLRLEAVGTLDEATAALGMARASIASAELKALLVDVQRDLYQIMSEVAASLKNAARFRKISVERVTWLEEITERYSQKIQIPKEFIVPGDTQAGAALDMARTIVRRAERRISALAHQGELENPALMPYLNRLSSLCFVLELYENQASGSSSLTLAKPGT